jgi:hypothetical protein
MDGEMAGPRIGPRIFIQLPYTSGSFQQYRLTGLTQDMAGAILGTCTVKLYDTATDAWLQTTTSDGLGAYAFTVSTATQTFYIVAYKATAPDQYGTTTNNLTAS